MWGVNAKQGVAAAGVVFYVGFGTCWLTARVYVGLEWCFVDTQGIRRVWVVLVGIRYRSIDATLTMLDLADSIAFKLWNEMS